MREGLEQSPWEGLKEQVVLGGEAFLERVRRSVNGDAREQRGAKRLGARRASLAQVIARVEQAKGEPWERFRDRYGDTGAGSGVVLEPTGMRADAQGIGPGHRAGYKAAASALQRYEGRLRGSKAERALLKRATSNAQ
ncbi:MAG: hypothetical protein AB9869_05025 [Verrucomicrobiia bacterium]